MRSHAPRNQHFLERAVPGQAAWETLHADHLARYLFAVEYVRGKRVLDVGTGPGYGAAILRTHGAASVYAIDIDPATIEGARRQYQLDGLTYGVDDAEALASVAGPFDVVCSFENIEHLHAPEKFLRAAVRILRPEGMLLCSSPDRARSDGEMRDGKPTNPFHVMEWSSMEFLELLHKYFGRIDLRCQVVSISWSCRSRAAQAVNQHVSYLWEAPLSRLVRAIRRLVGAKRHWPVLDGLAAPMIDDFPIVPSVVANAFGHPFCHYAICTQPHG